MVKKVSRRLQELQKKVEERAYTPIGLSLLKETATAVLKQLKHISAWELILSNRSTTTNNGGFAQRKGQVVRVAVIARRKGK